MEVVPVAVVPPVVGKEVMMYIPIDDLELLLGIPTEAELYERISGQFNRLNQEFWDKANLKLFDNLHLEKHRHVLDLACGAGGFAIEMAQRHSHLEVVGVDYHPDMLRQARQDAQAAGVNNVEFIEHDLSNLLPDFQDEHFDLGVCLFALSYLGVETILGELWRLLGPSGQIGITTSSFNSLSNWQPIFFEFFQENHDKLDLSQVPTAPPQPLDASDLKNRMEKIGFRNVFVEAVKVPLSFPNARQAASFLISSTWLSNQFYSVKDLDFRRFVVEWALKKITSLYPPGAPITTQIEFLVAWNEPGPR